ncbi:hypothetical protein G6F22_021771 [Rhizopus arrhizus]|nr:hypothetical protein G6F22_021771 [Rhizopus arrhizus]KAG0772202.1 hypothetical protein G6F21_014539 [Rhizopus arrhizus]KAG1218127.1 hypothetical protein G6F68_021634 [Rhizopus microsporus]
MRMCASSAWSMRRARWSASSTWTCMRARASVAVRGWMIAATAASAPMAACRRRWSIWYATSAVVPTASRPPSATTK